MGSSNGGVPPGFRFHPTDEELLHYYLKKKLSFQKFDMEVIREVDLNKMEPWDLQERCKIGSTPQNEWYFFSHKDRKYPTGSRTNRATNAGFWKATGRDKCIRNTFKKIGMRKTLVFYRGRAPHGQKTDWIMHEYRLEDSDDPQANSNEDGWVVCRVFKKKNLFKIGNEGSGGGSIMHNMNSDQQVNNNNNSSSINHLQARSFMHRSSESSYLLHQQNPRNSGFELDKPDLALHYPPPHLQNPHHQYSLFQPQSLIPTHKPTINAYNDHHFTSSYPSTLTSNSPPIPAKHLLANPRDCDGSGGDPGLRYQVLSPEVGGTCDQAPEMGTGRDGGGGDDDNDQDQVQGMNEWGVLDRLVSVTSHLGNEEHSSSKGIRFEDASNNAQTVHHINPLSLRGEMDFWGAMQNN